MMVSPRLGGVQDPLAQALHDLPANPPGPARGQDGHIPQVGGVAVVKQNPPHGYADPRSPGRRLQRWCGPGPPGPAAG